MNGWRRLTFDWRDYQPQATDHRPALDGVRGIAILVVFLYDCLKVPSGGVIQYALRKASTSGWVGVDLFFVLSGFLITGILLDTKGQPGFLKSFFARRSLRIFPLYFLALWGAFILAPQVVDFWGETRPVSLQAYRLSHEQGWFWFYLQNWHFAFQGHWPDISYLNHFWSLAVEEQFYLVWPFVVAGLSSKWLTRVCWVCVVAALMLRIGLWAVGAPSVALYVLTVTRMDSLCMGALLALGLRSPVWYPRLTRWAVPAMVILAVMIVGVDLIWPLLKTETVGAQTIGHTLLGMMFGAFVFTAAGLRPQTLAARWLSHPMLTVPGAYSYAMYVVHRPIYKLILKLDWSMLPVSAQPIVIFGVTLLATLGVSALSWKFFEKPFLSLKAYFPRPGESTTPGSPTEANPLLPRLVEER